MFDVMLLDIDGVIKKEGVLIPGIEAQLLRIINAGIEIKFVTNCSLHKINGLGNKIIPDREIEIIDPLDVLEEEIQNDSLLLQDYCMFIGAKDIRQRIKDLGFHIADIKTGEKPDIIFVFEKLNYDQEEITLASRHVMNGAKLVCAGSDRFFGFRGNAYPGVGAITAQIRYMANTDATLLGKPSKKIFELSIRKISAANAIFIGDDYTIDIIGAKRVGLKTGFIYDKIKNRNFSASGADITANDLKQLVDELIKNKK